MEKKKKDNEKKQSVKEIVKNSFSNGSKWVEKHKVVSYIILGVIAVILVILICFCSYRRENITASADSDTVNVPADSYIIATSNPPVIYCSWANDSNLSSLVYAPILYISKSGYYVSFGSRLTALSTTSLSSCQSYFYRYTRSGTNVTPYISDSFGFDGRIINATYLSSDFYDSLINGDLVISNVVFRNTVKLANTNWSNGFGYDIYVRQSSGNVLACSFSFSRNETPPSYYHNAIDINSNNSDVPFTYTVTYNGLSTSSAEFQAGYNAGKSDGVAEGEDSGYNRGLAVGDERGYQRGISEKIEDITPWQHIVSAVDTFFNIEILPSVRVSTVFAVGFGALLLGFAIKIFLGG